MSGLRTAAILAGLVLVAGTIFSAVTASNSVPTSRVGEVTDPVSAQKLAPGACSSLTLSALVNGTGTFSGTNAAELLLGSSGADSINGSGGNDCLVGGAGNDTLNGGTGTDVCLGQAGTDTFSGCEAQVQ